MPSLVSSKPAATGANNSDANNAPSTQQPAMIVPFVRASDENLQPGNIDQARLLVAGAQDLGVMDLPAYGYASHLYVLVEGTGGSGTGAVLTEDGPWNILQNIALTEPNGSYIVQFTNGYELYCANKYGGYNNPVSADPERSPSYSAVTAAGNFKYLLRVPIAVSGRDAVGALPNQDSAGQFKFRATIAPSATLFATPPSVALPTVRVRAWLQSWDQPEPTSAGVGNQVEPPANGTTSFWTVQSGITVNAGENTIEIKRKGNYLRQLLFLFRSGGSRATGEANWPAELRFMRDSFPARYYANDVWKHKMFETTGYTGTADTAGGPENGLRFHDYMHEFDGALGRENRDLWQPTRGSTRLEIAGNFGAGGTLTIITNDVAIAQNVFL
jgi:hypothetical protein